jgi:hypothetical protein
MIALIAVIAATAGTRAAQAVELRLTPTFALRWDNTLKYSGAVRLREQSSALLANINGDDGNRNFDPGFISPTVSCSGPG